MENDSLISHLIELRSRLIRILVVFLGVFIIGIPFANDIYPIFADPLIRLLPENSSMIATQVSSPFMVPIKLVASLSIFLTIPYFFYQIWLFIVPGLYKNEKAFLRPLFVSTAILFYSGVVFAYLVVMPVIFNFFINIAPSSIQIMTDINSYLGFVLKMLFGFGIAFEVPVATFLVITTGLITIEKITAARPYLIISFFVIAMILTPPDIFSQLFLAIPMWILFEIGIILAKLKG